MSKIIPTFEERVMRNIAKLKAMLGSGTFDLSQLNTTDKTSLIAAINEIKAYADSINSTLEDLVEVPITFETLQTLNLIGTASNQLAVGDHDHEIGDMVVLLENKLI